MLANSSLQPIGFSMKSKAPAFMALTAIGTLLCPVKMMAGVPSPAFRICCLHRVAVVFQQLAQRFADRDIVIDDEDDGKTGLVRRLVGEANCSIR